MLTQAILEAETDYLMLPFVENYRYLKKLYCAVETGKPVCQVSDTDG